MRLHETGAGPFQQAGQRNRAVVERIVTGNKTGHHARIHLARVGGHHRDHQVGGPALRQAMQDLDMGVAGAKKDQMF
jgi:hypothetical protein